VSVTRPDLALSTRLRHDIVKQVEAVTGRHDEPDVYGGAPGDPGLIGPGSISWEINGDMGSIAVAGLGAIVLEILHPSVMAGVEAQSSYRAQPLRRARNTLGYVVRTTFGTTEAATKVIEHVKRMHSRVEGTRPDGVPYRALDPDLIGWVHTAIPWGIMNAFDRYNRKLTVEEKNRYLAEQAVIGRMGGASWVPETVADLDAYAERMRPLMAFNEQTRAFIDFLCGETGDEQRASAREQLERRLSLKSSMTLLPDWAARLCGLQLPSVLKATYADPTNRLTAAALRWAYGTPPFVRLAQERTGVLEAAAA
jgi:uncharacterized protein (DUF2236 family)